MIKIDNDRCLKCGMCAATFPEVLEFNDEGDIEVKEENLNEENIKEIREFIETESCPANAIKEVKEEEKKED